MNKFWKLGLGSMLLIALASVASAAVMVPSNASAATSMYGRSEKHGYFNNSSSVGAWSCGGSGQLVCGGIVSINDVDTFITFYWNHLNSGNIQDQRIAAFTVLVMLGVNGPDTGGADNGVQMAKNRFSEWENLVQAYNTAGKINFNYAGFAFNTNTAYRASTNDIVWRNDTASATVISFDIGGGRYVAIKKACGNMVGDFAQLPPINIWSLSAASTANTATAKPGDTIHWTHTLNNNGPNSTSQNVHSNLAITGFANGWGTGPGEWAAGDTGAGAGVGAIRSIASWATYTVTQADVGNTLCEMVQYDPMNGTGGRDGRGNNACVAVPYNYTLAPSMTVDHSDVIEPNTPINITPSVSNTGPTKSQNTQWQLTQIIVKPGQTVPNSGGGAASQPPCGPYFSAAPNAVCSTKSSGTTVFSENGGGVGVIPVTVGDLPVGTQICFAFSVQPYSSSTSDWRHSAPICLTIGVKPKVQVWGGDLSVGKSFLGSSVTSKIETSTSVKTVGTTQNTFGSWVEYGIFATGEITGIASGSAYAGTTGLSAATGCQESHLSFTLAVGDSSCTKGYPVGNYSPTRSIPDVAASFPGGAVISSSDPVVPNDLLPGSGVYIGTRSGDLTLNADEPSGLAPGKSIIIKASGTVTIAGNQTYNSDNNGTKYTSASQLPQLVIIAKDIIINDNVTSVDAWLIANGTITTCSSTPPLTSDMCNQRLTVNGPVMAQKLVLLRTAGSGTGDASGDPAEVFNLRPDAYMWATARATGDGRIQTVYTTELPPRL